MSGSSLVQVLRDDSKKYAKAFKHMKLNPITKRTYGRYLVQTWILQAARKTISLVNRVNPTPQRISYDSDFELATGGGNAIEGPKEVQTTVEYVDTAANADAMSLSTISAGSEESELLKTVIKQLNLEHVLGISADAMNSLLFFDDKMSECCSNNDRSSNSSGNSWFTHTQEDLNFAALAADQAEHNEIKQRYDKRQREIADLEKRTNRLEMRYNIQLEHHRILAGPLRGKLAVAVANRTCIGGRARHLKWQLTYLIRAYENELTTGGVIENDLFFDNPKSARKDNVPRLDIAKWEKIQWERIVKVDRKLIKLQRKRDAIRAELQKASMELEKLWAKDTYLGRDMMAAQDALTKLRKEHETDEAKLLELEQKLVDNLTEIEWKAQQAREMLLREDRSVDDSITFEDDGENGEVAEPWDFGGGNVMDMEQEANPAGDPNGQQHEVESSTER